MSELGHFRLSVFSQACLGLFGVPLSRRRAVEKKKTGEQNCEFPTKYFGRKNLEAQELLSQATAVGARPALLTWKNFLTISHSKISAWQHSDAVLCSTRKATCSCFRSGATTPEAKHPSRLLSETLFFQLKSMNAKCDRGRKVVATTRSHG